MMIQKNILTINLSILSKLLISLCCSGSVQAQSQQSFKVELIVFSQTSHTSETFNNSSRSIQQPDDRIELSEARPLRQRQSFALIAESDLSLAPMVTKLLNSGSYNPLLHMGWVESVRANQLGRAIHISRNIGAGTLEGYVQLKRSHYLHYFVDLEYNAPRLSYNATDNPMINDNADVFEEGSGLKTYRIDEKRRILLNELHYFDHPRFGILVKVSPL